MRQHRIVQARIDPGRELAHEARIDGEALVEVLPATAVPAPVRRGAATEPRVDEVGRERRDAPQSLMPAATICASTPGLRFGGA